MERNPQVMSYPIVVGLDVGTTKICAIVGRQQQQGSIEILGVGNAESSGVIRGIVSNIDKTVKGITQAIDTAAAQSNVDVKLVHVGIAGQHIKSLQHRGLIIREDLNSEITHKDIDRLVADMYNLVMPPGEEIVHVLPQEFTVDNEPGIKDPIGMAGVRLEANFHIISAQISAVRNILKCVHKANLESQALIVESLAASEAVLSQEEKEAGVVLVDIGGGTTDIAIFHENITRHTAVIPFGGNSVTEDIREGCSVMRTVAEQLKVRFGSGLAEENKENELVCVPGLRGRDSKEIFVKNLAYIIQARMEEIMEEVYYEIESSGYAKKLIAGIVITGGCAQLKHLPQLVESVTGLDCRVGYLNEHLVRSPSLPETIYNALQSPVYATGIGLLIKGIQQKMNQGDILAHPVKKTALSLKKRGSDAYEKASFFDRILEKGKKFIKDDIDDADFLK